VNLLATRVGAALAPFLLDNGAAPHRKQVALLHLGLGLIVGTVDHDVGLSEDVHVPVKETAKDATANHVAEHGGNDTLGRDVLAVGNWLGLGLGA